MSGSSSQLPKTKKAKKDRKNLKKAQDEANAVYESLSNGQIDILSKYSTEHILGLRLSNYDRNLLHVAVWFNVEALIDKICCNSALKSLVNDKDANGETPLHLCVFCQNVQAYQKLLAAGANLEITNNKGERPLDTALDPVKWQNYQSQIQAGISPVVQSDQIAKSEGIKNPEPQPQPQSQSQQSPQQEQPQPVVVQKPEIRKNEEKNKPIENKNEKEKNIEKSVEKKDEDKNKQSENNKEKSIEKKTLEVQQIDSKEMPSPNFGVVNKDVAKTNPKEDAQKPQPEIQTPIPNKTQDQTVTHKSVTKITPFNEKEVQKAESHNSNEIKKPSNDQKVDNKVTPVSQEKKSQDLRVTPILQEKDISVTKNQDLKIENKVTPISLENKNKQDIKLPPQKDPKVEKKDTPLVLQEKTISTIPTNPNQNKDTTRVPAPQPEKTIKDTPSNPLNLVISPKTDGDTVPQPRKNTRQKEVVPPKEDSKKIEPNNIPTPHSNKSQHSATHNTNPMSISTIPQKSLNDLTPHSLVNHDTTPQEIQSKKVDNTIKKPQNNDSPLIETFAKPQNNTSALNKTETASPTKHNTSRTNLSLNNEQKSNNSPKKTVDASSKKDPRKRSESPIPDILDKTDKKMPILNLQPSPIKTQQKRENSKETIRAPITNSSSRLNESSLPSLKKESKTGSRGESKTPFRTNAREILGSNNPSSLTFETKSPIKVESKRDLSRNKISSKSILIDEKSPAKGENSSLMNKRPNMNSYKSSGANLQLDISRKTKEDYPNKKTDQGYRVGSRVDSDSNSSPGLQFNMNSRRLSNVQLHSKYTNNESLKLLEQRNRSVGKVDSNEVIFEYSGHSQANIRTKTEINKDWDSIFDISMHTEENADKSFSGSRPLRPGRMLYMSPIDNTYQSMKPIISPEKKERTLSPIRDKDPEYNFGKPLVPSLDKIFGREKSPGGKKGEESPSPLRKGEMIYVTNNDFNFTTQGSDVPLNANRRYKRDTWKGGNFG